MEATRESDFLYGRNCSRGDAPTSRYLTKHSAPCSRASKATHTPPLYRYINIYTTMEALHWVASNTTTALLTATVVAVASLIVYLQKSNKEAAIDFDVPLPPQCQPGWQGTVLENPSIKVCSVLSISAAEKQKNKTKSFGIHGSEMRFSMYTYCPILSLGNPKFLIRIHLCRSLGLPKFNVIARQLVSCLVRSTQQRRMVSIEPWFAQKMHRLPGLRRRLLSDERY